MSDSRAGDAGTIRAANPRGDGSDLPGVILVVLSAFCYSSLGIFGKVALGEGMRLPSLLATRFLLAAAILWTVVLVSPRLRGQVRAARGRRAGLLLWGLLGFAGQSSLFFSALHYVSASLAEVLLYTCPAFLAVIVWLKTGRRPAAAEQAAIALALAGTWLVAAPPGGATISTPGAILGIGAGLWYAGFLLVLDRVTPGVPAFVSTTFIVTGAATAFVASLPLLGGYAPPPTASAWGAVVGLVGGATLLGFTFFLIGLRRVGPQVAAILSTFEPVGTLFLARVFLGERLRPTQWAGTALVLGAAFVLAARPARAADPAGTTGTGRSDAPD